MINEAKIKEFIRILKNGGNIENPKIELKKEWWDFTQEKGLSEFVKDTTALANTYGGNGYIVIGIDEKSGETFNSPFPSHSKYNDPTKLGNIIFSKVQEPFNIEFFEHIIEGKQITVIEIAESFNKPHIIKRHVTAKSEIQNFIPVRKSTGTRPADKFDLDMMYSNRNISTPNYKLEIYTPKKVISHQQDCSPNRGFAINISILNTGQRTNIVTRGELVILAKEDKSEKYKFEMKQFRYLDGSINDWFKIENQDYIIIQPNEIKKISIGFSIPKDILAEFNYEYSLGLKNFELQFNIFDIKDIQSTSNVFSIIK